jgi:hypothetical protein
MDGTWPVAESVKGGIGLEGLSRRRFGFFQNFHSLIILKFVVSERDYCRSAYLPNLLLAPSLNELFPQGMFKTRPKARLRKKFSMPAGHESQAY